MLGAAAAVAALAALLFRLNLPNALSLFRLFLVPCFAAAFFSQFSGARFWAAGIYGLAFVTDVADGYIARSSGQVTKLGRILDPMADKLMTFTVILSIALTGAIPLWAAVIFFLKEISMGVGGVLMLKYLGDVTPANLLGKISTGAFFVVCALLILFPQIPAPWATGLISAALVLTLMAFFNYLRLFIQKLREKKKG